MAPQNDYIEIGGLIDEDTTAWDGEGGNLPELGRHLCEITKAEKGTSKKSGSPQVLVGYKVTDEKDESNGRQITGYYSLTQKAIGRLLNVLAACGVELDAKGNFAASALVGKKLSINIVQNSYADGKNPVTGEAIMKTNVKVVGEEAYTPPAPTGRTIKK